MSIYFNVYISFKKQDKNISFIIIHHSGQLFLQIVMKCVHVNRKQVVCSAVNCLFSRMYYEQVKVMVKSESSDFLFLFGTDDEVDRNTHVENDCVFNILPSPLVVELCLIRTKRHWF